MADGYDRVDNESGGGSSFVIGLLTGTVLGAGLGMLFAPKTGADARNQLSEQANTLANTASEGYRRATETAGELANKAGELANKAGDFANTRTGDIKNKAGDIATKGREFYDKARDAVSKGSEEAQRYVRDSAAEPRISRPVSVPPSGGGTTFGNGSESFRGAPGGPSGGSRG